MRRSGPVSRALRFDRALGTCVRPVAPQNLAALLIRVAIGQPLAGRTPIDILLGDVDEVLLAKAAIRFGTRRQRLRQRHRDASLVTREDLQAVEVAAIGDGFELIRLQNRLRLLGDIRKLCPIRAGIRHLVRDDQMMLALDRNLHIVADDTGAAATRCHRATVGIGQRDLLIGRSKHPLLVGRELSHLRFASFSLSRVAFASSASVGSCRSAVSSWLKYRATLSSSCARRRSTFARVKFLSRLLTALNLLPSMAILPVVRRPISRQSSTKRAQYLA